MKNSSQKMSQKNAVENELLDIVDEQNKVLTQGKRREIHVQGLRHRAVHILIYNQQGDLFLQKRSINKDEFAGCWDSSAAGHVDAGESYDHCVLREVEEELGIVLKSIPEKLFMLEASDNTGMEFCQVYKATHDGPFILNTEEIDEGRWFSQAEIKGWLQAGGDGLTPAIILMIEKASDHD